MSLSQSINLPPATASSKRFCDYVQIASATVIEDLLSQALDTSPLRFAGSLRHLKLPMKRTAPYYFKNLRRLDVPKQAPLDVPSSVLLRVPGSVQERLCTNPTLACLKAPKSM